jgi:hypothetical protein
MATDTELMSRAGHAFHEAQSLVHRLWDMYLACRAERDLFADEVRRLRAELAREIERRTAA